MLQGGETQCKGWTVGSAVPRVKKTQLAAPALVYGASEPMKQNKF